MVWQSYETELWMVLEKASLRECAAVYLGLLSLR